ncbi:MAG: hypothetical protein ACJAR8_001648 [Bacteroidia bacterium]|jgi:hypothetical protein
MKLYLAYISLFLVSYQYIDDKKDISGKYVGSSLGKSELVLQDNGKFVSKGYHLVPKQKRPIDHPPSNMPSPTEWDDLKKSRFKSKGNWVYWKLDGLDGIIRTTNTYIDTLYFLENDNLSPNNPRANIHGVLKLPDEFVKQ